MRHCLGLVTKTQTSVCKSPFPCENGSAETTVAKKVKTRLLDCGVTHEVGIDHLSRLPVIPPVMLLTANVSVILNCEVHVSNCSDCGL